MVNIKEYFTSSAAQTKKVAKMLAKRFLKFKKKNRALILALKGDLGSGKTTFLQGWAQGLGIKERILSPTFILMKKFDIKSSSSPFKHFYHIDCYRIRRVKEILDLDFKKIVSCPQNIVAVEWAEKIKRILPAETIWINFEFINKNKRKIIFKKDKNN